MAGLLIILFIAIPILEIYLLISIGSAIGVNLTLGIIILTGIIGSWLVRKQGLKTLQLINKDLAEGKLPADRIISGLLILVGGVLLITPGIFTDFVGFMLMVPGNRRILIKVIKEKFQTGIENNSSNFFFFNGKNIDNNPEL